MDKKSYLNKDLSGMTKGEMYALLMQLRRNTKYPVAKQMFEGALGFFDDKCPGCFESTEKSRYLRTFREKDDFDIVTYICTNCGTVYRKYEDKREVIAGNLLEAIEGR